MKKTYTLGITLASFLLLLLAKVSAQISIDSFSADTVQPGEELDLDLQLENVGEEDIENIIVSIDLTDLPFAPKESSTEKVIDEIKDGEEETVSFQLVALASAEAQTYKIPVSISYENTTKSSLVSVEVRTDAKLSVLLESSDLLIEEQQGAVTIKIVNEGLTQVKFVTLTLLESTEYEILSPDSVYIGEIDSGDFETEEFTIIAKRSDPELKIELEYRDTNNEEYIQKEELEVKAYSTEEARELGLLKQGNTLTWILLLLVLLLVTALWIRRKRKKHVH